MSIINDLTDAGHQRALNPARPWMALWDKQVGRGPGAEGVKYGCWGLYALLFARGVGEGILGMLSRGQPCAAGCPGKFVPPCPHHHHAAFLRCTQTRPVPCQLPAAPSCPDSAAHPPPRRLRTSITHRILTAHCP